MVLYCFVEGCKSKKYHAGELKDSSLQFYGFPRCPETRKKWINAFLDLNRQDISSYLPKTSRICKMHFSSGCFEQFGLSSIRLKPNSVPTIFPRTLGQSSEISMESHTKISKLVSEDSTDSIGKKFQEETVIIQPFDNDTQKENPKTDVHPIANDHDYTLNSEKHEDNEVNNSVEQTPKKTVRYPGDVDDNILQKISLVTSSRIIKMLKRKCQEKDRIIKCYRTRENRYKKKIESLHGLLSELKKNFYFQKIRVKLCR